jgi:RES domain-containing protein
MQAHPRSAEIAAAIAKCIRHVDAWEGAFFRFTTIRYANRVDLVSGKGSQVYGGRWNPKGSFRSVYGSLDPHTAMAEVLGSYRDRGIPISKATPRVVVSIAARLQAVLDVSSNEFLDSLGLSISDLTQLDWKAEQLAGREALTQAVGRQAYAARLEAIIVPSTRAPAEKNIVVFPRRGRRGSTMRTENARDLPKRN